MARAFKKLLEFIKAWRLASEGRRVGSAWVLPPISTVKAIIVRLFQFITAPPSWHVHAVEFLVSTPFHVAGVAYTSVLRLKIALFAVLGGIVGRCWFFSPCPVEWPD
jgi:hypothetical protein